MTIFKSTHLICKSRGNEDIIRTFLINCISFHLLYSRLWSSQVWGDIPKEKKTSTSVYTSNKQSHFFCSNLFDMNWLPTVSTPTTPRQLGLHQTFQLDTLVLESGHFVVDQRFFDITIIWVFMQNFEIFLATFKGSQMISKSVNNRLKD